MLKEHALFQSESQKILFLGSLAYGYDEDWSTLCRSFSLFLYLGVRLEVTIVVRYVFDLLVITDLAKDTGFTSFILSTRAFNKRSFVQWW